MTPEKLLEQIGILARRHSIGTAGLAGPHAIGNATEADPVDVFVCRCLCRVRPFGAELAETLQREVHVHDVTRLPFLSPLHLAVRWTNADTLPRVPCLRGSITQIRMGGTSWSVPLSNVPHFVPVDRVPPPKPGRVTDKYGPSPGALLL